MSARATRAPRKISFFFSSRGDHAAFLREVEANPAIALKVMTKLAKLKSTSHIQRHQAIGCLLRNSIATALKMRPLNNAITGI